MKTPAFWYLKRPNVGARILAPLGHLYFMGTARRLAHGSGYKSKRPVICVGNVTAGGNGKTPMTIDLFMRLQSLGHRPVALSKGYGGRLRQTVLVDPRKHTSDEVGDEPLLLAQFGPVVVAPDRVRGVQFAQDHGSVIIMDDGFQDPSVQHDYSFLVVDVQKGFGNGYGIPAGPLREPVAKALARADHLVMIGGREEISAFEQRADLPEDIPKSHGFLDVLPTGIDWRDQKVMAFAGIASPERFLNTLQDLGAEVIKFEALADHQPIAPSLLRRLRETAQAKGAQLVTTEKDAARIGPDKMHGILTVPVRLQWHDDGPMTHMFRVLDDRGLPR